MGTRWLDTRTFRGRHGTPIRASYEHPWLVRLTHWLSAIALFVMAGSGIQILRAFPAFGPKVPEHDIVNVPRALALGGWLAGGLQWHFTFMWFFAGAGLLYVATQIVTGRYRMVLFRRSDARGVWPMVRHYFLFGPRSPLSQPYNPLQKLAYTTTLAFGVVSVSTGLVLYKPAQFSLLATMFGGYHMARIWHFAAMCGLLAFVPGHLVMVALHGWNNFSAMLVGWKQEPEYALADQWVRGVRSRKSESPIVAGPDIQSVGEFASSGVAGSEVESVGESDSPQVARSEVERVRESESPRLTEPEVQGDGESGSPKIAESAGAEVAACERQRGGREA